MLNDNIINILAKLPLLFSKEVTIVPAIAIGYHFINRRIFINVAGILFFMMILNTYLKSIWQIPLPANVGNGWSFPSGHMASAIVFWGYLALEYKNKTFRAAVVFLLLGVATSLIYFSYHNLIDVLGALFFSSIVLVGYTFCCRSINDEDLFKLFFSLISISGVLIWFLPKSFTHVWIALGGLSVFSISSMITTTQNKTQDRLKKIVLLGLGIPCIYGISKLFIKFEVYHESLVLIGLYTVLALWIVLGVDLAVNSINKVQKGIK
jgi:hypothetical protein